MGRKKKKRRNKEKLKIEFSKEEFVKEKLAYCEIISTLSDIRKYLNSFYEYIFDRISLFEFMDITDNIIEMSKISDEELKKINDILKVKFVKEEYTVDKILFELSIMNNKVISYERKYELLTNNLNGKNQFLLDYSNWSGYKKIIPEDLKRYDEMNGVTSIVYNAVGTKR